MRQTFDDYNETCQMVYGSAAIHPHNLGLLMLRGISRSGPHGQAKQCVINAFDTYYLLSADEVMASILHLAHNMDDDRPAPDTPAPVDPATGRITPSHLRVRRCGPRLAQRSRPTTP
jgi:hypothetical protein